MAPYRRLVRRQPLQERISAFLDPWDFLLWISEELETGEWEQWQSDWAVPIGIGINLIMVIARANTGISGDADDDIFSDEASVGSFFAWLATFIVHLLSLLSFANAFFTFHRTRPYRLFEAPIDDVPSTPSARRVAVDSSPTTSSPLRVISTLLPSAASSAWKRAHPDPTKDVWELSVWDPLPICLRTFCLFSPGHVLVYWLFLPALPTDPRPSVTVFTALLLGALLSAQLSLLQGAFERRAKDNAVVSKEVLHEYDTKFVHPHTHRMARDVGTQFSTPPDQQPPKRRSADGVVVGTNRVEIYKPRLSGSATTFRNLSNPNYTAWVDPDGGGYTETPPRRPQHPPPTRSAATGTAQQPGSALRPLPTPSRDLTSPLLQRSSAAQARQPYRASTGMGDGGSLGVYSHAHSPLKKAASTHFVPGRGLGQVQGGNRRESGRF